MTKILPYPASSPPAHPLSQIQSWFDETLANAGDREILEQAGQLYEAMGHLTRSFSDVASSTEEEEELLYLSKVLDHYASRFKKNRVHATCSYLDKENVAQHLTNSVIAATGLAASVSVDVQTQLETRVERYR